jgi:enterochelin esterase-like enzyme
MKYVVEDVLPWADECLGRRLPRLVFGVSNGAAWAASLGAEHPDLVVGVLAFSLGVLPCEAVPVGAPAHALVAGRLEPGFCRDTTTYARKLRGVGVPVRLRTPMRGHDYTMWRDEFVPALRRALHATA